MGPECAVWAHLTSAPVMQLCVTPAAVKTCYSIVALDGFPALGALTSSVSLNLQISELKKENYEE